MRVWSRDVKTDVFFKQLIVFLLDYQGVIDNSTTITLKRAAGTKPKDNEEQKWEGHPCFGFSDLRWSSPICKKSEHTFIHHTSNCDCHAIIAVKPSYQTVQVWHCMGGELFLFPTYTVTAFRRRVSWRNVEKDWALLGYAHRRAPWREWLPYWGMGYGIQHYRIWRICSAV